MNRLESDLLRTFLAVADAGSFLGGAARISRSQSAASIQIKKLEDLLGTPVFARHGRGVVLTAAGERLEPAARQVVQLLDRTMADMTQGSLVGTLRIGIPDDHSKDALSRIIADFGRDHPNVELSVQCALSTGFSVMLAAGDLDIAVHEVERITPEMVPLRQEKLCWAASRRHDVAGRDPLPVALFDRACWWRDVALKSLKASGRPYRIVYSSETATGVAAAIEAGIAIGVLNASALGPDLAPVTDTARLAALPASHLVIEYGSDMDEDICNAMTQAIRKAFAQDH
jgi:DNA-binding transcriptional LysR family regulator